MAKGKTQVAEPQKAADNVQSEQLPLSYEVRIYGPKASGVTRATASVEINGAFAVRGIKIMESSKGLFVSMPNYNAGNGEFKDICFPCTKESYEQFSRAVIDAYEQALSQAQRQKSAPGIPQQTPGAAPSKSQSM